MNRVFDTLSESAAELLEPADYVWIVSPVPAIPVRTMSICHQITHAQAHDFQHFDYLSRSIKYERIRLMSIPLTDYDYDLPEDRIAQSPAQPRDSSRLMLLNKTSGSINHRIFRDIVDELKEGDVLVMNNTKVFKARLSSFNTRTDTEIEVVFLRPRGDKIWEAMLGPGRRAKLGDTLDFGGLQAQVLQKNDDGTARVRVNVADDVVIAFCDHHGEVPLPPYISKKLDDARQYQTVYAEAVGSVAAPTAGLHFTPGLLKMLNNKGVQIEYLTLHVGLGTFQAVKSEIFEDHKMHSEFVEISSGTAEAINRAKDEGRRIVAVGTTTVRALEGAVAPLSPPMNGGRSMSELVGDVDLFIKPGFEFKVVDALITNFHLPKSTLLLLVSAFAGKENVLGAYRVAIDEGYRFYSFGDVMFIR